MGQIDQARALLRLGAEDTEEARTAAWQAARLIAKQGFGLYVPSEVEELQRQLEEAKQILIARAAVASTTRRVEAEAWHDQVKTSLVDFAKQTMKHAGVVMPEIVYAKRVTACNQCGKKCRPNQRMSRHPKYGLRCITCASRFL